MPSNMFARFALPQERPFVEALARLHPDTKDFVYHWERWGNWNSQPPVTVWLRNGLAGFHAATFSSRTKYVNSYYQFVAPAYQGQGAGGAMVEFLLATARQRGMLRFKMKTPFHSRGYAFWQGFGLRPFGRNNREYLFDVDISHVGNCAELIASVKAHSSADWKDIPPEQFARYKKMGVILL